MKTMRKTSTLRNSISGLINKVVSIVFVFVVRHVFVKYFSTDYLGLEGLFANVLGLFSLVDLGLGNAISFNLYEPLHNNDRGTISAIMSLYKRIYIIIGLIVFGLSLCFSPFIVNFIKDNTLPNNDIRMYFLIYALGIAITYLFSYKRTLIFAMQKNYLVLNVDTMTKVLLSILQIIVIVYFGNYAMYLIVIVFINLIGNVVISRILDSTNRYDVKTNEKLPQSFINKLKEHVKALAVTNVAWQCIASTDNIIISSMVGIIDLAKNANYSTITTSINGIVSVILGGASASVGDLLVEKEPGKTKKYFDRYCFIYAIVSAYAALGVYFVSKPVITIWVGRKLVFDDATVLFIAVNVFLASSFRPLADYQNYSGNFVYYRPYSIGAVAINLVVSIVLARIIGIKGVFIGTTATYVFMTICVIRILFKHLFHIAIWDYVKREAIAISPMIISFFVIRYALVFLPGDESIDVVLSFLIVSLVYPIVVTCVLWRNEEFRYFGGLVIKIIKNKTIKRL